MIGIANNGKGILLDANFEEFEIRKNDPFFIIYHQFLNQLHLPYEKWEYSKTNKGNIIIKETWRLEQMDEILFKELDLKKLVSPERLYTYYLLQLFLGIDSHYNAIGLVRGKKDRFIYLNNTISFSSALPSRFFIDDFGRMILKKMKQADIELMHNSFFVLINTSFVSKLLNALTLYQTTTKEKIDKSRFVSEIVNNKRLEALKVFSLNIIKQI